MASLKLDCSKDRRSAIKIHLFISKGELRISLSQSCAKFGFARANSRYGAKKKARDVVRIMIVRVQHL
jgi:hypothetical protein